jgi:hypothetical protein
MIKTLLGMDSTENDKSLYFFVFFRFEACCHFAPPTCLRITLKTYRDLNYFAPLSTSELASAVGRGRGRGQKIQTESCKKTIFMAL